MSAAARWARGHAGAVLAALVALAIAAAASVARCQAVHAPEGAGDAPTPEEVAEESLPAELRALRDGYDATTEDAIALLAANVWVSGQGTTVVRPTARAILTQERGEETWEAYAVTACATRELDVAGTRTRMTTLCLATADWCGIATISEPTDGGGATLSCAHVAGGAELAASAELKEVTIDGPDGAVMAAHGTTPEEVARALAAWCATMRPTATTAEWAQAIEEDYAEGKASIYYRLDDRAGSRVTVEVPMGGGTPTVREGGR